MTTADTQARPAGRRGISRIIDGARGLPSVLGKRSSKSGLSSVLAVVCGDRSDEHTVRVACQLLNPHNGTLHLLYIIVVDRALPVDAEVTPATAKGDEVLRHMEDVAKPFGFEIQAELLQSRESGCAVVQESVEKRVEAVVLGVPYRERYGTFGLGDTVSYVLKHAPTQVVLWREPPSEENSGTGGPG